MLMQVKVWYSVPLGRDVFYSSDDMLDANCDTSEFKIRYTGVELSMRKSVTPGCVLPTGITTAHDLIFKCGWNNLIHITTQVSSIFYHRLCIRSTGQKPALLLWNQKVFYSVNNKTSLDFILSQMNPVQTAPFFFCKFHFDTVLLHMSRSYQ